MNDHTHTDKTLQGNNKIESAIAALQQEPSQEMLAHTLTLPLLPASRYRQSRPMMAANGGRHLPASMKNSKVPEA